MRSRVSSTSPALTGALGRTALLFVNALAGGALALITPALASLARAQAARAAVAEAARRAPELVQSLGDDLGARLAQVIDDFATRLEAFIGEAGASLAQGISEVLERALSERKSGVTLAEEEELTDTALKLRRLDEQLVELRQAMWQSA